MMLGRFISRGAALSGAVRPLGATCFTRAFSSDGEYSNIKVSTDGKVGVIQLHRPKALNALSGALFEDVNRALDAFEADKNISAVVLTGSDKAFAAGADITEMAPKSYMQMYGSGDFDKWDRINRFSKPVIAAVNGFALGGGCELAMMCDIIVAGESAQFGQPEIKLGTVRTEMGAGKAPTEEGGGGECCEEGKGAPDVYCNARGMRSVSVLTLAQIPGAGGSQRLTRAVGKSKSMEMNLTGTFISAQEARDYGLVSHVVPAENTVDKAKEIASTIATYSQPIVRMVKDCVNRSFELSLSEGLNYERRIFYSTFATADQKEGMDAFVKRRKPEFKDE